MLVVAIIQLNKLKYDVETLFSSVLKYQNNANFIKGKYQFIWVGRYSYFFELS